MKKITLMLFALIAGTTFAQNTDTAIAPVNAEIVSPIGITLDTDTSMDFGKFTKSASDATVILTANGTSRTFSETDMEIAAFTSFDVPSFTVTKDTDVTYKVAMDITEAVSGGVTLTDLTSTIDPTGNSGTTFSIGGTLNVPTTATTGSHSGKVSVTVTYE